MKIVTAGSTYLDIDAYAGCIAYAELLCAQGIDAKAISTAIPNASIPKDYIDSEGISLVDNYVPNPEDTFVLVDLSNPEFFDAMVVESRVEEIFDHHVGYEEYWKDKIGDKANIEFVGAACTLIYEAWSEAGKVSMMKSHTAMLLCAGILDNTLNFKAVITSDRDREAYASIQKIGKLADAFAEDYFKKCEQNMANDFIAALENDKKDIQFPQASFKTTIMQLAVWDAQELIKKYLDDISEYGESLDNEWFMNILSVADGASYFIAGSEQVKELSRELFEIDFNGNVGKAPRLWLRKEMIKHTSDIKSS